VNRPNDPKEAAGVGKPCGKLIFGSYVYVANCVDIEGGWRHLTAKTYYYGGSHIGDILDGLGDQFIDVRGSVPERAICDEENLV
jgi:hypothetical protein